ncbi:CAAX geranylgeranyltransferase alpha subunit [Coemansia sp. RSA 2607]|nr:CAAX geranylgeranyltransferase alpha subunit [Coemansia sp. RSA 2607]
MARATLIDDNSDVDEVEEVPLSQQPEWADVTPLEQQDGGYPLCPIAYTDSYKELMGYMRAVMAAGEISKRAYSLTSQVIEENPAHYTVWVYRKRLVTELSLDIEAELNWLSDIAAMHPKNYQPWHHRQVLVAMLLEPQQLDETHPVIRRELSFLANAIDEDSKNFHAWSYRQWLVQRYDLWTQEESFVDAMINQDVRNNSAWNQRYFVLVRSNRDSKVDEQKVRDEIEYSLEMIKRAPNNESPWSYIVGMLLRHAPEMLHAELLPRIQRMAEEGDTAQAMQASSFYWSALVDIYETQAMLQENVREEMITLARETCAVLASDHDPTRMKYWEFRGSTLKA